MLKLSFIVPVYNVEKYLKKCLDSLLLKNVPSDTYEIIIVDDGSTDSSAEILAGFDWKGANHKVLYQENQGQSVARNKGLDFASGEYVWFVDSDDWIDSDSVAAVLDELCDCDVLAFTSFVKIFDSGSQTNSVENAPGPGLEFSLSPFFHGVPFYVFKREFIVKNHLSFYPGIYYEDSLFMPMALSLASYVKTYKRPVYFNYMRQGSTTRSSFSRVKLKSYKTVIDGLNAFCLSQVPEQFRKKWSSNIAAVINGMAKVASQSGDSSLAKAAGEYIDNIQNVWSLKYSSKLPTRIWYFLGKLAGNKYFEVYKVLSKLRYAQS